MSRFLNTHRVTPSPPVSKLGRLDEEQPVMPHHQPCTHWIRMVTNLFNLYQYFF